MQKEPLLIRKFDGGWNSEDASDELQAHESPDMENVDFTKGGAITKIAGLSELGSDSDDETIAKLVKAPNRNGMNYLFKFSGTTMKVYDAVNSLWAVVKTGLTAGNKWGDNTFDNVLIVVNTVDDAMSFDLGQVTRLNGAILVGATTIAVDDTIQLEASGDVFINNVSVSYTGKSGNNLTGCTNAVATPDNYLVTQALSTHAGMPKGEMCINFGGRLIIAGVTGSGGATIYGSKATDRTSFSISGGGACDDAFAEASTSKINAIRVFYDDSLNERIMIFMANNAIRTMNVEDDDLLGTLVILKFFKGSVTAINHFSTVVGQNDIYHIDFNNQIRTLGPRTDDGSGRNYSDSISTKHKTLFRDEYNFDSSAGTIVNDEYWCICKEENDNYNDRIIIYDKNKHAWKKKIGITSADILEFNNKVTIADAITNKVYQVNTSKLDDDNSAIKFKYSTFDFDKSPLRFERLRALRISGIISSNCIFTVKIYRDFGSILLGTFTINGNNEEIIGAVLEVAGTFGQVAFGGMEFGGDETKDRKFFIAHLELPNMPDLENFRAVIENNQQGVYLEISKIKPLIFTKNEDYFPSNYILKNNN